ncbi:MAG TPA: extracellular solute-binding protein, partial [Actinomycetota bacterium]
MSRRNFLGLAAGTAAGLALAGCGSSGPSNTGGGGGGGGGASYWFLTSPPGEQIRQASVDRFNQANPDAKITVTKFQNDAYKTKIKTAIGAGQAPTIIWGWGGGGLRSYVQASQVEDLTSWFAENTAVKDR